MIRKYKPKEFLIRFFILAMVLQLYLFPASTLAAPVQIPVLAHSSPPTSSCDSYLLADYTTGDLLIANAPNERIYPASTTKIMTAVLLLENEPDLSKKVTVGEEVIGLPEGTQNMHLVKGEVISLKDLLYGLLVYSAGDAAMTIAVDVGGSIQGFADKMNAKAQELGMTQTHFTNPHGLNDENHYSTAADMAKLAIYAMSNQTFREVVSTSSYKRSATNKQPTEKVLKTTNKLISTVAENKKYNYQYAVGIKTGYTNAAGGCLIAAAAKDGQTFIAVLMGDRSDLQLKRWVDAKKLLDFAFTQKRIDLFPKIKATPLSAVIPGDKEASALTAIIKTTSIVKWLDASMVDQLANDATPLEVNIALNLPSSPKPTGTNVVLGTVTYSYQGTVLYSCDVTRKYEEQLELNDQAKGLVKLVSLILIIIAALLLTILILRNVLLTRDKYRRRYSQNTGRAAGRRLRDPHDYK